MNELTPIQARVIGCLMDSGESPYAMVRAFILSWTVLTEVAALMPALFFARHSNHLNRYWPIIKSLESRCYPLPLNSKWPLPP